MATENTISQNLYDLLITRNFDPETTDAQGQASQPGEGSVFTFDWISSQGTNYGTAVIVLTDDNELQLFFGDNLGKSMDDAEDKQEWFDFMQQLSQFATRNNFNTFTPRNISQLKHTMAGMAAIKEGLFEGYYGTRRMSYMGEQTQARLVIQHNRVLGENDKRYHNIDKLFIETVEGERFKLPFRNLAGGRAMLEHVRQGGRPYDICGNHITEMVSELAVLNRFRRANHGQIREADAGALVAQVDAYYQQLQENLKRLSGARGYSGYFESWSPATVTQVESLVEDLKTLFVEQTIDHRIEAALPVLAKIQNQGNSMKEADIFERWANRITEGTWAMPETPQQQAQLKALMSQELIVGADAINATQQLYDLIGDDQLFDQLADLAEQDPDADARPVVMARLQELGLVPPQDKEPAQPTVQEGDNLATFVEGTCNETREGESCPVHGMAECGMHEDEFDDAMKDYEMRGGKIQQEPGRMPRLSTRLRRQGSHHIGTASARPTKGRITGQGANTGTSSNKPVVTAEGLQPGEYHIATVTLDDGTTKRVRITSDEGYRDKIQKHFARQGQQVTDIQVDFAVRTDENKPRFTGVPARNPDSPEIQSHGTLPPAPGRPTFTYKPGDRPSVDALDRLKTLAFAKTR